MNKPYTGSIHAERLANCPYSIAQEYAEEYLREAESGSDALVVYAGPIGKRVAVRFGRQTDTTDDGRVHEAIDLRWSVTTPLLPQFRGILRLRIAGTQTRLILDGRYEPPGGMFGTLFDRVIGNRIAASTANTLLDRIARALTSREVAWRQRVNASMR